VKIAVKRQNIKAAKERSSEIQMMANKLIRAVAAPLAQTCARVIAGTIKGRIMPLEDVKVSSDLELPFLILACEPVETWLASVYGEDRLRRTLDGTDPACQPFPMPKPDTATMTAASDVLWWQRFTDLVKGGKAWQGT
jgi:hypothetical protein